MENNDNVFQFPAHEVREWREIEAKIRESTHAAGVEPAAADYICKRLRRVLDALQPATINLPVPEAAMDAFMTADQFYRRQYGVLFMELIVVYAELYRVTQ